MPVTLEKTAEKASSSAINTMIRRIKRAQETNNIRVQNCLLMIAEHSSSYGDCSGMARLLNALPAGLARNASVIIDTMKAFTPILCDMKGGVFVVRLAREGSREFKKYDIDGLRANPWYDRPEAQKDPKILDLDSLGDQLLKLADRIMKKIEKGEVDQHQTAELQIVANGLRVFAKTQIPTVIPSDMTPDGDVNVKPEAEAEAEATGLDAVFEPELRVVNG